MKNNKLLFKASEKGNYEYSEEFNRVIKIIDCRFHKKNIC